VVLTEHPDPVGEQRLERVDGVVPPARFGERLGEVAAGVECGRVVGAEEAFAVGEQST
jgi:hypothetical protein